MELRDTVIAPCRLEDPKSGRVIGADAGALLQNVLLFPRNILDSTYLREFPALVDSLGVEQVILLLEEGNLQIKCDARTLGENGESPRFPGRSRTDPLPPGTYCFNLGWDMSPNEFFRDALDALGRRLDGRISKALLSRLIEAVEASFVALPEEFGQGALAQLEADLGESHVDLYRAALAHVVDTEWEDRGIESYGLEIEVEPIGDGAFKTSTNLASYGVEACEEHEIVRSALFAIGQLDMRLEEMRALDGISGFQERELPLFDAKIDFLERQLAPEAQGDRFGTVVTLAGLPDFNAALLSGQKINVERLLNVCGSAECHSFRAWLRTLDYMDEAEIRDRIGGLRATVSEAARSRGGRVIRFLAVSGAGAVPGIGLPLGIGLGAMDSFVLDKLLGDPGPILFMGKHYKSILE